MKLIIGLGNPGQRYINTRHNIGFRAIEELADRAGARLRKKFFLHAKEAYTTIAKERVVLIEPLTFMNLSGGCIARYIKKESAEPESILVICDDVNLPLGSVRIRSQGSSGGHNGLESIISNLKRSDFPRLRLGVGKTDTIYDLADYVLSDFRKEETEDLDEMIARSADACECWIRDGIDKAMNLFNK